MHAPPSLPSSRPNALHELLDPGRLSRIGVDATAVALTDGTETLTWAAVVDAVARLGGAMTELGVGPGARVGVHLRKSVWSFVAVHAVVRVGAVMVPLDPLAPPAAAAAVLDEAEVTVLVTDAPARSLPDLLSRGPAPALLRRGPAVDLGGGPMVGWDDALAHAPAPPARVGTDDPAYIIFTSGSTGRPKGIVHTHASALAYADRAVATYGIGPEDVLANIAALHFDQSTFELYAGPLAGARVLVVPDAVLRFPASLAELIERSGATVVYTVPFVLRQLVERGALDQRDLASIRWIKFGGEVYPHGDVAALMAAVPSARLSNVYGPAEVNQCTHHHLDRPPDGPVPIGRPWDGVEVLVCDSDGHAVATGETGELWVAAPTMMAGYWRRPELTARSIVERRGRSWYRTGDVVRWRDDVLEFLGRDDHQVKVRGQRVELEAVEAAIVELPGIADAGVVARRDDGPDGPGDGSIELVAAVIADPDVDLAAARATLARRLGPAAVPARFLRVPGLPRTSNGKIDRGVLREALLNGAADVPDGAPPAPTEPADPGHRHRGHR